VGTSVEGEMHLVMDAIVSYPIQCILIFVLFIFIYKRIAEGHFPGVVTSGDNVAHKNFTEMRRLAHDETPFLLSMTPRDTTLVW
jgi:hypothetical protein